MYPTQRHYCICCKILLVLILQEREASEDHAAGESATVTNVDVDVPEETSPKIIESCKLQASDAESFLGLKDSLLNASEDSFDLAISSSVLAVSNEVATDASCASEDHNSKPTSPGVRSLFD